jgi:hypothetical protein
LGTWEFSAPPFHAALLFFSVYFLFFFFMVNTHPATTSSLFLAQHVGNSALALPSLSSLPCIARAKGNLTDAITITDRSTAVLSAAHQVALCGFIKSRQPIRSSSLHIKQGSAIRLRCCLDCSAPVLLCCTAALTTALLLPLTPPRLWGPIHFLPSSRSRSTLELTKGPPSPSLGLLQFFNGQGPDYLLSHPEILIPTLFHLDAVSILLCRSLDPPPLPSPSPVSPNPIPLDFPVPIQSRLTSVSMLTHPPP